MLVFYLLICLFCFIFLPGFVWFLGVLGCVVLCWVGFCRELLTVLCVRSGLVCFCCGGFLVAVLDVVGVGWWCDQPAPGGGALFWLLCR